LIDNPADLAIAFANVVTYESANADDWVARNGDRSIFSALRLVLPEVRHEHFADTDRSKSKNLASARLK
jgi:hypothetical protein